MKALKSVEEAAGLLGISPWTIRGYIQDRKLRPVRLGRRVLIEEADLEKLIASGKAPLGDGEQGNDTNKGITGRASGRGSCLRKFVTKKYSSVRVQSARSPILRSPISTSLYHRSFIEEHMEEQDFDVIHEQSWEKNI